MRKSALVIDISEDQVDRIEHRAVPCLFRATQVDPQMLSVLIVDDEPHITERLRPHFLPRYTPMNAAIDRRPHEIVVEIRPALVVLNPNLPWLDAEAFCTFLRQQVGIPFIVVSDGHEDVIEALDGGAEDYLAKPYSPRELVARIAAVLRVHA